MNLTAEAPYLQFIEQAQKTPDAIAVLQGETQLTYAQLHHLSNQVANYLRTQGIDRNHLVGIMTQRGSLMIIGILGILKAGGAYVPVDPSYPSDRIRYILNHAKVNILVTESQVCEKLQDCLAENSSLQTLMFLDAQETLHTPLTQVNRDNWSTAPDTTPSANNDPDDLMTVLYTSGSTGRPKGVMLNHRGYMNRLQWMQDTFQLQPGERVAQKTSFCFDISVWEIFWTLMTGATICPVDREIVLNPWDFAQWMKDMQINIMHFVPSLFGEFIGALETESHVFSDLRWLIFSGEALPLVFIQRWIDRHGMQTGLANLYGPTEASIDVTSHIITQRPDEKITTQIPIGKAIDNVYLRILDEQMQPVTPGEIGELWIGGIQLAKGYLNDSERTSDAFRVNPFSDIPGDHLYHTGDLTKELPDGSIEYHGRIDHQVKIRGFRIELGEIESVLNLHPEVREAAVLAIDYGDGQKRLLAWVSGAKAVDQRQIKQFLNQTLPQYMIPQRVEWLPSLPKNHNGKLDRKALQARLQEKNTPSSAKVTESITEPITKPITEYLPLGSAQRWLVKYFEPPYQWTGYTRFRYHQSLNIDVFSQALTALMDRHPAMRTVFVQQDGQWQQQETSSQPLNLHILEAQLTDEERDRQMIDQIQHLSQNLRIDQSPLVAVIVAQVNASCYDIAVIAHHIIADMLTTNVIFNDLWYAYNQVVAGQPLKFESPTPPSYGDYVRLLQAADQQGSLASHIDYWKSEFPSEDHVFQPPFDHRQGDNVEASAAIEQFSFTQAQSNALLRTGKQYYKCNVYALLLAPLYQLMAHWANSSLVIVSHRSHGRNLDNGHTFWDSMGDFAINYPLGMTVKAGEPWEQTIQHLKDKFEGLPMQGVTFDWVADRLPDYVYPDSRLTPVRVNYLGNRSVLALKGFEFLQEERDRRLAPPEQKRTTLLEVFFSMIDGTFDLKIEYSRNFYLAKTIRHLGEQYMQLMDDLLANSSSQASTQSNQS
jgi:fengycin family lipopeptide synthetase B